MNYPEHKGDFLAKVPGCEKQASYSSTVAYMASLLIHRYHQLGLLNEDGTVENESLFAEVHAHHENHVMMGKKCPECGAHAVVKYNGCDRCSSCGHVGSCG